SIAFDRYLRGSPAEWLFGIGVRSAEEAVFQEKGTGFGVHSDFLATLIECGIIGLMAYLFLLVMTGWALFRVRRYLPRQHTARIFSTVGWALFVAFTIMGIPGALYTNVFVGWYYYGFIGFILAQLKGANLCFQHALSVTYGVDRSAKAVSPA